MCGSLETLDLIRQAEQPVLVWIEPDAALRCRWLGRTPLPNDPDSDGIPMGYSPGGSIGLIGVWSETAGQWLELTEDTVFALLQRRRIYNVEYDDRSE
jgi:hypothetical protein